MKAFLIALIASTSLSTGVFAADGSAPVAQAVPTPTPAILTSTAPAATPPTSAPAANTAASAPAAVAPTAPVASTATSEPEHSETAAPTPPHAPIRKAATAAAHQPKVSEKKTAQAPKKMNVRHAKYDGGEGSTWKTGENAYGFQGSFGGCQYRGHVSPAGYTLDKSC